MVKAYLKYDYQQALGLLNQGGRQVLVVDQYIVTGANEYVLVVNTKTKETTKALRRDSPEGWAQVTCLERAPGEQSQVAVGYSSGEVLLWDLDKQVLLMELNEHSSSVNCLAFSQDQQYLFSGGADTHIFVIDLVQQKSLFRLSGHNNQVTHLAHFQVQQEAHQQHLLLSSGKDGLLKIWDLTLNTEVAAISTNSVELMDFMLLNDTLLLFSQNNLSFYRLHLHRDQQGVLQYYSALGVFKRSHYSKVLQSQLCSDGSLFLLTQDNTLEHYLMLDRSLVLKKMKRKVQRLHAKEEKQELDREAFCQEVQNNIQFLRTHHLKDKVLSFRVSGHKDKRELLLSYDKKGIVVYGFQEESLKEKQDLGQMAHQEQVMCLDMASDDNLCLSLSKDQLKVWHTDPSHPFQLKGILRADHGLSTARFLPKGRFIVAGDNTGSLILFDLRNMQSVFQEQFQQKRVTSIDYHSKPQGAAGIVVMAGSADKSVMFCQLSLGQDGSLGLKKVKSIDLGEDVLCVRYMPSGSHYAVSLLDNSIRVFFSDSDKEHLSLYGHKLPVHCIDISSDSTLLASGSNDKNIRVWGLDYGDCRRSILAHEGAVTSLSFLRDTHYLFSTGKDALTKQWDVDTYEQTQELPQDLQHSLALALTSTADYLFTAGKDRVVRVFRQTQQQVFAQELQQEKQEKMVLEEQTDNKHRDDQAKVTQQNIKYGEEVMEALDLLSQIEMDKQNNDTSITARGNLFQLGGQSADDYLLGVLKAIRFSDLEKSLKFVHMTYIQQIVALLERTVAQKRELELCTRILVFILQKDENYLVHSKGTVSSLHNIQGMLRKELSRLHGQLHFNQQGLRLLHKEIETQRQAQAFINESKSFSFI